MLLYTVWLYGPLKMSIIVFADVCIGLQYWTENIKKCPSFDEIRKQCLNLSQNGLQKANQIFSVTLFSIIVFVLVCLVFSVYGVISYLSFVLTTDISGQSGVLIFTAGYIMYSLDLLFTLIYLNALSHQVTQKVRELQESLLELEVTCSNLSKNHLTQVIHLLGLFKGFDCCGFFLLGRPRLTAITATFATYIIILVQFKYTFVVQDTK